MADKLQKSIQSCVEKSLNNFLSTPHKLNKMNAMAIKRGSLDIHDLPGMQKTFFNQLQVFDSVTSCAFGMESGNFSSAGRRRNGSFESAVADKTLDNKYRVYLLNTDGEPTKTITTINDYQPKWRSWYQEAVNAQGPTWSPIYIWASRNNIGISAVLPVYNDNNQLLGVQLSALSLEYIGQFIQNIKSISSGEIFIMERTGELVASSTSEPMLRTKNSNSDNQFERITAQASSSPLIRNTAKYIDKNINIKKITTKLKLKFGISGKKYFLSIIPFSDEYGLDWVTVIVIPQSDLMGAVAASTRETIITSCCILLIALCAGIGVTHRVTKPIMKLYKATQLMSNGNWETITTNTKFTEVKSLTNSFNHMASQLKKHFEVLEKRVQARTQKLTVINKRLQNEITERKKAELEREKLILELQEALENVKNLSGLLPICAHCKKIRDENGQWHDVATYVRDRSEADFTHGICPECANKFYGEFMDHD